MHDLSVFYGSSRAPDDAVFVRTRHDDRSDLSSGMPALATHASAHDLPGDDVSLRRIHVLTNISRPHPAQVQVYPDVALWVLHDGEPTRTDLSGRLQLGCLLD